MVLASLFPFATRGANLGGIAGGFNARVIPPLPQLESRCALALAAIDWPSQPRLIASQASRIWWLVGWPTLVMRADIA